MTTNQLIAQMLAEQVEALNNGSELGILLNPVIIAVEDGYPIDQSTMIQPVQQRVTAMQEQATRLQTLLSELKVTTQK